MLKINEELSKKENIMIEIKPQIKNEAGEWIQNKDYKLELIGGEVVKITPKNGSESFEKAVYHFDILNDDGTRQKGFYEIPTTNKKGEINYQIKKMIELELDKGDIILLGTDEKGYISITKVGEASEELPTINADDDEEIDPKNIPF